MAKSKDSPKVKKIKKETKKLKQIFESSKINGLELANEFIENLAFLKISCIELQDIINSEGYTEHYQNGANQSGTKTRSEVETYNKFFNNYMKAIKILMDKIPVEERKEASDKLMDFLKR